MRKKFLQGVLTLGMAAAICFGASAVQADAAVTDTNIKVDGTEQTLSISGASGDEEVLVGFAKQGAKNGKTTFKVDSWDIYEPESGNVTVDLSHLNSAKDNFVIVKDLSGNKFVIQIPAAAKGCFPTYDATKDELEVKAGAGKSAAQAATKYEYRTAVGKWKDGAALNKGIATPGFGKYQQKGATLYLRVPGGAIGAIAENDELKDVYEADNLSEDAKITKTYKSVSLPSKEAKLKISKQAAGPKATVDYVKGNISLPANTEYRIYGVDGSSSGFVKDGNSIKITKNATKGTKTVAELMKKDASNNYAKGFIEIRTAANTEKKKSASKWTHIDLETPAKFTDKELAVPDTSDKAKAGYVNEIQNSGKEWYAKANPDIKVSTDDGGPVSYGGCGVANAKITDGADSNAKVLVDVKYGDVNAKTSEGKVIFTNHGDDTYQIVVKDKSDAVPTDTDKASILKAGNGKTLTLSKLKTNQWIFIRKAGVKNTKQMVGVYKVMGVVDIPLIKVVEKVETPQS